MRLSCLRVPKWAVGKGSMIKGDFSSLYFHFLNQEAYLTFARTSALLSQFGLHNVKNKFR